MATLLQHNKVRNATHNILAYRIYDEAKEAWLQVDLWFGLLVVPDLSLQAKHY